MQLRSLYLITLLSILIIIFIISGINPLKRTIWFYEVTPAILLLIFLWRTYSDFPLTPFSYCIIFIGTILMFIGGHYTYAEVPLFDYFKEIFHFSRNHFDRLGHLFFGMIIATLTREWMIRLHWFRNTRWVSLAFILLTLAVSSGYELFEFSIGLLSGTDLQNFLGTQGDPWDSHWDIISAVMGAIIVWILSKWQDKQIKALNETYS